jgi:membrane-associated protein
MHFVQFVIDFILHIDQHLPPLIAAYGSLIYLILFVIVFSETGLVVTPFLPGDSLLFVAGTLAATGDMRLATLMSVLALAAVLGNQVNYLIGRFFGHKLFANPNSKIFRRAYLDRTHAFYQKHGGKTLIFARFMPIIRTFAPFVAGIGEMSLMRFTLFNLAGSLLWVGLFCLAGYLFGNIPVIRHNLELLVLGIIVVSFLPAIVGIVRHRRSRAR